ncbi:MAG: MoaD/ThiS family protein [Gammaproteobacteria bacterium]|nr:MoaD/ThiS family protein [Gammaproteobacteria bacterium]NIR83155.1 MoaD/ThiS family protein [Gammaproteobacteria bacterium]NIR90963.1 MoaD/ThiS family protein [Gammaproteobacteria bacterium]NIU04320.1 MoaD/ThiS family protein [Gammaproteobacteria bacterium]NIV52543.1 MoaD/ThiS family protein [Gammaproteobacteria bacterium]
MKITVKATGLLAKHLPAGAEGNTAPIEVNEGATPADVIAQLGMPGEGRYLVAVNGSVVPAAEHATHRLTDNDTLAIMPPIRGGSP